MSSRRAVALMAMVFCLANHVHAQSAEERAAAREMVAKHGGAVLFVLGHDEAAHQPGWQGSAEPGSADSGDGHGASTAPGSA